MKKIIFSLAAVLLLLTSCSSDEVTGDNSNEKGTGTLYGSITFAGVNNTARSTKAEVSSSSIPLTSWGNINQVHMFLYKRDTNTPNNEIVFSYVFSPSAAQTEFSWSNIPVGKYRLALVANVKSGSDDISTTINNIANELNAYNVLGLKVNDLANGVAFDLKSTNLPTANHSFASGKSGYLAPSEIFTAYEDIEIVEGVRTLADNLQLRREVSLMRLRLAETDDVDLSDVNFEDADLSGILVHRLPIGFNLPVNATESSFSGRGSSTSDIDRVLIAKTGKNTFKFTAPEDLTHTNPGTILNSGEFSMWQEFCVLPNEVTSGTITDVDAASDRKYFLVISASVPDGYVYADGSVAENEVNPVYWYVTINKNFPANAIREVNIRIKSNGFPEAPIEPQPEGGLDIEVSAPLDWENILVEGVEV